MSLALFAPPTRLAHADELPLGARVTWTHRAAVARWATNRSAYVTSSSWRLTEGLDDRYWRPTFSASRLAESAEMIAWMEGADDPWYDRQPGPRDPNKTIAVWPDDGDGYLFGLVRRGIGRSYSASGTGTSSAWGVDEYEPGGFAADAFVPLYAVKSTLSGVGYMLAPHWAVSVHAASRAHGGASAQQTR